MFLIRLRPLYLFLLMMVPMVLSAILAEAPAFATTNALRLQVVSVNLSTFFAVVFVSWIATLTYTLSPGKNSRWLIIVLLAAGTAFRAWQDSLMIDELYAYGRIMPLENLEILSPLFILHALVSLVVLATLMLLSIWIVRKEKASGINSRPLWLTIVQFFVFPIGLFWIQKRMQTVFPENNTGSES